MMIAVEKVAEWRAEWVAHALKKEQIEQAPTVEQIRNLKTGWCPARMPVHMVDRVLGLGLADEAPKDELFRFRRIETAAGDALMMLALAAEDGHVRSPAIDYEQVKNPCARGLVLMPEAVDLRVSEEKREMIGSFVFGNVLMHFLTEVHLPAFAKLVQTYGTKPPALH